MANIADCKLTDLSIAASIYSEHSNVVNGNDEKCNKHYLVADISAHRCCVAMVRGGNGTEMERQTECIHDEGYHSLLSALSDHFMERVLVEQAHDRQRREDTVEMAKTLLRANMLSENVIKHLHDWYQGDIAVRYEHFHRESALELTITPTKLKQLGLDHFVSDFDGLLTQWKAENDGVRIDEFILVGDVMQSVPAIRSCIELHFEEIKVHGTNDNTMAAGGCAIMSARRQMLREEIVVAGFMRESAKKMDMFVPMEIVRSIHEKYAGVYIPNVTK